jgi:hypothetical protein
VRLSPALHPHRPPGPGRRTQVGLQARDRRTDHQACWRDPRKNLRQAVADLRTDHRTRRHRHVRPRPPGPTPTRTCGSGCAVLRAQNGQAEPAGANPVRTCGRRMLGTSCSARPQPRPPNERAGGDWIRRVGRRPGNCVPSLQARPLSRLRDRPLPPGSTNSGKSSPSDGQFTPPGAAPSALPPSHKARFRRAFSSRTCEPSTASANGARTGQRFADPPTAGFGDALRSDANRRSGRDG